MTEKKPTPRDLRKFGFTFALIFIVFLMGIPWLRHRKLHLWVLIPALILATLSVAIPRWLIPVRKAWLGFGHVMGSVNNRIILGLVYVVIFVPMAVVMRLLSKDPLNRAFNKKLDTYRIKSARADSRQTMKRIF